MQKSFSTLDYTRRIVPVVLGAVASVLFVAAVTWAATTVNNNVNTGGTLTVSGVSTLTGTTSAGAIYASSTVFADGDFTATRNTNIGAASGTPTVTGLNVTGDGYFDSGLGVGNATTSDGNLLVNNLAVFRGRLGISTTSPTVDFGLVGSGYLTGGLGIGNATTSNGNLLVENLAVFRGRLGISTTSPTVDFGLVGSGYLTGGFGVGTATTSAGGLLVSGMGVFNSAIDVRSGTSTFAGSSFGLMGSSTPYLEVGIAGDVAVGGALGTSTVSIESTSAGKGGCIELRAENGRWLRLYAGGTGTTTGSFGVVPAGGNSLVVEQGRCQTGNE
ncbi:MAG: hypothetical protein Q7S66_05270 [bacterium]|nr:hypothetical protein [bacterium]